MLCGLPDPSYAFLQYAKVGLIGISGKAMRSKSTRYLARLEEIRADARALIGRDGEQYLDEALRAGATGARSVSNLMADKEREQGQGEVPRARESG